MTYTYLGDGTRAAARADAGVNAGATSYAGKRYRGTFVYDVTSGGVQSLESVAVSTGRLTALTGSNGAVSFESDGFITDHLGNVAVVVNLSASSSTSTGNAILEQNEYTPFGTKLSVEGLKSQAANRWRYAGKEEQDIAGMNLRLLDFGARYYDSFTCRWNAVDPLAHKYFPMSPYNYCGNDPVNFFDPDGRDKNIQHKRRTIIIEANIYTRAGGENKQGNSYTEAVQNAVNTINKLSGLSYEKDGITYSVQFKLSVRPTKNMEQDFKSDGKSNSVDFERKAYLAIDKNGDAQMGQTKGNKTKLVESEMKNESSIIHEIFHLLGACKKKKGQDHERYATYGVMVKTTNAAIDEYNKGHVIDQESINEIIESK